MANVAQQFRAMNAYVNGEGYAGRVHEFHPPRLRVTTEEYQAAGMDMPVLLDVGMEPLEAMVILNGIDGNILSQFGLADANAANMQIRAALEDYDGSTTAVQYTMRGNVVDIPQGRIRGRGEVPQMSLGMSVSQYKIEIGGTTFIEIDALNMIRNVNNVDRLLDLRQIIGV